VQLAARWVRRAPGRRPERNRRHTGDHGEPSGGGAKSRLHGHDPTEPGVATIDHVVPFQSSVSGLVSPVLALW
jgi:hypothetical protein